jgi:hypothetical protein
VSPFLLAYLSVCPSHLFDFHFQYVLDINALFEYQDSAFQNNTAMMIEMRTLKVG